MLLHPLTYTREAASCPTFLGWKAEAAGGAADGISGGRPIPMPTPPPDSTPAPMPIPSGGYDGMGE